MTATVSPVKQEALQSLDKLATERRIEASIPAATALTLVFGLFASVPISVRQRDWKIWALPFLAGLTLMFGGWDTAKDEIHPFGKVLGWSTQAGLVAFFMKQNKDDAKQKLANEEASN